MERTAADGTFRWKKVGGGDFRIGHRIIKEGEIFTATQAEIPMAFRDIIIALDTLPVEAAVAPVAPAKVVPVTYSLEATDAPEDAKNKETKYFNVVNGAGKVINEKPLTETKAKQLIKDLE